MFITTGLSTGNGLSILGTSLTSGSGILLNTTSNTTSSAEAINITGSAAAITTDFTGAWINVTPSRTLTAAATRTDSGQSLNIARTQTVNNAGATYNITGDVALLSSNCTQTAGTCTDTSNILELSQLYTNASGGFLMCLALELATLQV